MVKGVLHGGGSVAYCHIYRLQNVHKIKNFIFSFCEAEKI